jgi:hypothetical protein
VGTGYVGLVTGACFAYLGHRVTCVDRDEDRISGLGLGRMPVYEPGLEEMVSRVVARERLDFAGGEGLAGPSLRPTCSSSRLTRLRGRTGQRWPLLQKLRA